MLARNTQANYSDERITEKLAKLGKSNRCDRRFMQRLASFAQCSNPDVMAELLDLLTTKLSHLQNKWVFAAIGCALLTSTLTEAKHFAKGQSSIPVNLLSELVEHAKKVHVEQGADWETLYFGLFAISACINALFFAEVNGITEDVHEKTKAFFEKIKSIKNKPPLILFFYQQTKKQFKQLYPDTKTDSLKSSIKNELAKGGLNSGLAFLYLGAGASALAASIVATVATMGGAAPAIAGAVFGFILMAGLAGERLYTAGKNGLLIKRKMEERGYLAKTKLALSALGKDSDPDLLSDKEQNELLDLNNYLTKVVATIDQKKTSTLEVRQLLFQLFQLLKYVAFEKSNIQIILNTIFTIYAKYQSTSEKNDEVKHFLLEQLKDLMDGNRIDGLVTSTQLVELKGKLNTFASSSDEKKLIEEYLSDNAEPRYWDINFIPDETHYLEICPAQIDAAESSNILNSMANEEPLLLQSKQTYEIEIAGLESQRDIHSIKIENQDKQCLVVPAKPDGNCGFTAISRCLKLINRYEAIDHTPLTKRRFIRKVTEYWEKEGNGPEIQYEKALISAIFEEDEKKEDNPQKKLRRNAADPLENWKSNFASLYLGEPHLRFIAYCYQLRFEVFAVDRESTVDHESSKFVPKLSFEVIKANQETEPATITIRLAHLIVGRKSRYPNHFEGILLEEELLAPQLLRAQNQIQKWRNSEHPIEQKQSYPTQNSNKAEQQKPVPCQQQELPSIFKLEQPETGIYYLSVDYEQSWMTEELASKISEKVAELFRYNQVKNSQKTNKRDCLKAIRYRFKKPGSAEVLLKTLDEFVSAYQANTIIAEEQIAHEDQAKAPDNNLNGVSLKHHRQVAAHNNEETGTELSSLKSKATQLQPKTAKKRKHKKRSRGDARFFPAQDNVPNTGLNTQVNASNGPSS